MSYEVLTTAIGILLGFAAFMRYIFHLLDGNKKETTERIEEHKKHIDLIEERIDRNERELRESRAILVNVQNDIRHLEKTSAGMKDTLDKFFERINHIDRRLNQIIGVIEGHVNK